MGIGYRGGSPRTANTSTPTTSRNSSANRALDRNRRATNRKKAGERCRFLLTSEVLFQRVVAIARVVGHLTGLHALQFALHLGVQRLTGLTAHLADAFRHGPRVVLVHVAEARFIEAAGPIVAGTQYRHAREDACGVARSAVLADGRQRNDHGPREEGGAPAGGAATETVDRHSYSRPPASPEMGNGK